MYCKKCGIEFLSGAFCPSCGADNSSQVNHTNNPSVKTATKARNDFENQNDDLQKTVLTKNAVLQQAPKKPSTNKKATTVAIIIVAAILIATLGMIVSGICKTNKYDFDAEYSLNTFSVFALEGIEENEECDLVVDSFESDSEKPYHVEFKITYKKPYASLNLDNGEYVFKITYKNNTVNHKVTADENCKDNMVSLNANDLSSAPVINQNGDSFLSNNDVELYRPVLEEYKELLNDVVTKDSHEEIYDETNYKYLSEDAATRVSLPYVRTSFKNGEYKIVYSFEDIDKNGVPELVTGIGYDSRNNDIIAIYTYKDDEFYELDAMYTERGQIDIFDNGIILSSGSGGASLHGWTFKKIASDGKGLDVLYYLMLETYDAPKYSNFNSEISEDEFKKIFSETIGATDYYDFTSSERYVKLDWHDLDEIDEAGNSVKTTDLSTKKDNDTLLKDYFNDNLKSNNGAYTLFDFDKNGKNDMLVTRNYFVGQTDVIDHFDISLVKTKDNSAYIADTFTISDEVFKDYAVFISADSDIHLPQYVECYLNSDGYISCNCFAKVNTWGVHYLTLEVKNDKITVAKHLLDPGYTSGNGINNYDLYRDHYADSFLYAFDMDPSIEEQGIYKNYKSALDNEIGVYGFEFQEYDDFDDMINEKYMIKQTNSVTKVYSYRNQYANYGD